MTTCLRCIIVLFIILGNEDATCTRKKASKKEGKKERKQESLFSFVWKPIKYIGSLDF